jgi:hypothetical protein
MWYDEQRGADAARGGAHGSMAGSRLRLASQQYAEAAPSAVGRAVGGAAGAELGSSKSPLYVTQVTSTETLFTRFSNAILPTSSSHNADC